MDCTKPLVDENGRMIKISDKYINLGYFCQLEAVVNKKMKMCEIYMYPEIRILNETADNVKLVKKICKDADKKKVQLLPIEINAEFPTHLAFIDNKVRLKAILYKYFGTQYESYLGKVNGTTIVSYIGGFLFDYPEKEIRGYYLRNYIFKNFPEEDQLALREAEQNNAERYALPEEIYTRRWEYLKQKDNFKGFDVWYNAIVEEALKEMKQVSESEKFKTYAQVNAKKIIPFRYKDLIWPKVADLEDQN